MKRCLLFLSLCSVCLTAYADDPADERRRLMVWYAREIQHWRKIGAGIPQY